MTTRWQQPERRGPAAGIWPVSLPDRLRDVVLGQAVQLRGEAGRRLGYIVAVMMAAPYEALVRWPDGPPTFESLGDLITPVADHAR